MAKLFKLISRLFYYLLSTIPFCFNFLRYYKRQKIIGYYKGLFCEYFCIFLLRISGHRILGRRIKTKFGEIDVLASRRGVIKVFEVKYRSEGLNAAKFALQSSVKRVKKAYVSLKKRGPVQFRYFVQSGIRFQFGSMDR